MIKKIVAYSVRDFLAVEDGQKISKEEDSALRAIGDELNDLIRQADNVIFFGTTITTEKALTIENTLFKPDDDYPTSLQVELTIGVDTKASNYFDPDCLIVARLEHGNLFINHVWRDEDYKSVLS